ncbi:hypothetical protein [Psychroflexus torquis]
MWLADRQKLRQACLKTVTLYREGLFYKCYNEDAMVFLKNLKWFS